MEASASYLGIHPFSLLMRIQAGEIEAKRARSGEMVIPLEWLENIRPEGIKVEQGEAINLPLSDSQLGIGNRLGKLKQKGQRPMRFTVSGRDGYFSGDEIESYRKVFAAIAGVIGSAAKLKQQLDGNAKVFPVTETEIATSHEGRWRVHATLLNLGSSDVVLCEQGLNKFAVIEQFREDSPFARARGQSHILLEDQQPEALVSDFKTNARHTLEFLASNAVATAQKAAWEKFPHHRPDQVVSAISARCRQALGQTIATNQRQAVTRGVHL